MLKKFFWTFLAMAVVVWTSSWWAWALYHKAVHAKGWSEARLVSHAAGAFAVFTLVYIFTKGVILKKEGFGWKAVIVRLLLAFLGLCMVAALAAREPNAEGLDIIFSFFLAFVSGHIVYSKIEKFDAARFFAALLAWIFIIVTNELLVQNLLSFRKSQINDIIFDVSSILVGLLLGAAWFWTKRAGRLHKLSMLG